MYWHKNQLLVIKPESEMQLNTLEHSSELTWYCCDDFANLKPVEYSGFAGTIESKDQYASFSGAKQTTEVAEQASCTPHIYRRISYC